MFKFSKNENKSEQKEERRLSMQTNASSVQRQVVSYSRHKISHSLTTSISLGTDNLSGGCTSLPVLGQYSIPERDATSFSPPGLAPLYHPIPSTGKINVKKTGKFYDTGDGKLPIYKTSGKIRGKALIINNVIFQKSSYREGADKDEVNICELFRQMGFKVKSKHNLKKSDMKNEIRTFSHKSSLKKVDILVLVVMSHGTNQALKGSYTEVFGVDDKGLDTESIFEFFTNANCPNMAGKPKIFIFQCCRGNNEAFDYTDATVVKRGTFEDMLIAYSTLPGYPSRRNPEKGSWYIQTLCDVFSEYAHKYDIENLLKIVKEELSKIGANYNVRQTSNYTNWGFKVCYFHP